jgi:hypothetical protein
MVGGRRPAKGPVEGGTVGADALVEPTVTTSVVTAGTVETRTRSPVKFPSKDPHRNSSRKRYSSVSHSSKQKLLRQHTEPTGGRRRETESRSRFNFFRCVSVSRREEDTGWDDKTDCNNM